MALSKLTAVTPDILAMTWASPDALRMWFQRRKTTIADLGLVIREAGERWGVAAAPDDGVALQSVSHPGGSDDAFELWAGEVDALLQVANEEPERDDVLQQIFGMGLDAQAGCDEIVARRSAALEASFTRDEASCADCDASRACWGAPDRCEVRLARAEPPVPVFLKPAEPPVVVPVGTLEGDARAHADRMLAKSMAPVEEPAIVAGAEHPGVTAVRETQLAEASRQEALDECAAGTASTFHVRLAMPVHWDEALRLARLVAKQIGVGVHVCDSLTGAVTEAFVGAPVEAAPAPPRKGEKADRLPMIATLLDRPNGCTAGEMQQALGWGTPPSSFFFKEWARKLDRLGDLTDLGGVGPARRFRLEPARHAHEEARR